MAITQSSSSHSNGAGVWKKTGSSTAGLKPCPFSVSTWRRIGPSSSFTNSR